MTPSIIEVQTGIQKCKSWSDEFWLDLVDLAATQSHCLKKKVACVIVDKKKRLVSMGVNGTLAGCQISVKMAMVRLFIEKYYMLK